ncbi:MAG: hypothetical protein JW986_05860, partial [Methanotrichaceae archaeon]|nr:hypothetical protein [Methanotrichaceae archaeon]
MSPHALRLSASILLLFFLISFADAADLPFVFSEDTPSLEGLDLAELQDLAFAASELEGVPEISQVPEDEVMEWTEVGGAPSASGGTKSTAGELKGIFNSRVDVGERIVRDTALLLAADYPGELSIDQVCAIFEFMKVGGGSSRGWTYVQDPRGIDYYAYASQTLENGQKKNVSGIGDCDDFAILMAALVESIGGTTRIILAYNQSVGHAYTEVYLGCVNQSGDRVEDVVEALKERYEIEKIFTHIDTTTGEVWLNLDWGADQAGLYHPGGPFFPGTKHIPLLIRDQYPKTPMRPPEGFSPRPKADETGLIMVLGNLSNPKYSVAYSPDGRTLASGNDNGTVSLWDANSGRELRTLSGHSDWVRSVAFSPDGRTIASGSDDKTVKLWEASTGRELRTLSGHSGNVNAVAFRPDGRTLVSGSDDKTVKLWDANSGRELRTLSGHSAWVLSVAFSPDGRTIASGSNDKTVKLWDASTGRELRTLSGHSNWVLSVAFSPDGRTIASGSWDDTVKLWDASTGRELRTLSGHSDYVRAVAFSPDGRTLASGSSDSTVKLWDANTGRELRTLSGHSSGVQSVAFSPDGRTIASGSSDSTVKLWDANTGRELRTLSGHSRDVNAVAFSPDGRTLASGSDDNTVKLWDASTGRELRTLSGHSGSVQSLAF